jgi:hypothetical protein
MEHKIYVKKDNMNLQENIQRIREMMKLKESSFASYMRDNLDQKRKEQNPYRGKEYNPENTGNFSDSKVKDIVWRAGEIKLDPRAGGIWFAENKEDVEKFAWSVRNEKREGKPYHINLHNPFYYEGFWYGYLNDANSQGREQLMDMLAADGHDGIIIDTDTWNDTGDEYSVTSKQYVVFNPENVKPA